MRRKFICGNWKMNLNVTESEQLANKLLEIKNKDCDILVAPTFTALDRVSKILKGEIFISSQSISEYDKGAYTGEVSYRDLVDMGVEYAIIGHSERREIFKETNEDINAKVRKAIEKGINVILCLGEDLKVREENKHEDFVKEELLESLKDIEFNAENLTIAYEPIWAIGTGNTCSKEDAESMCKFIRESLKELIDNSEDIRILYGGSVKGSNAKELLSMPNIDGALVGGASLKYEDFAEIIDKGV